MPEVWGEVNGSIGAEPQVQPILIHITSLHTAKVCFLPSAVLFIPLTSARLLRGLIPARLLAHFSVLLRRWGVEVRNMATSSACIDQCPHVQEVVKARNDLLRWKVRLVTS